MSQDTSKNKVSNDEIESKENPQTPKRTKKSKPNILSPETSKQQKRLKQTPIRTAKPKSRINEKLTQVPNRSENPFLRDFSNENYQREQEIGEIIEFREGECQPPLFGRFPNNDFKECKNPKYLKYRNYTLNAGILSVYFGAIIKKDTKEKHYAFEVHFKPNPFSDLKNKKIRVIQIVSMKINGIPITIRNKIANLEDTLLVISNNDNTDKLTVLRTSLVNYNFIHYDDTINKSHWFIDQSIYENIFYGGRTNKSSNPNEEEFVKHESLPNFVMEDAPNVFKYGGFLLYSG